MLKMCLIYVHLIYIHIIKKVQIISNMVCEQNNNKKLKNGNFPILFLRTKIKICHIFKDNIFTYLTLNIIIILCDLSYF
jgi:hypothetical protein